MSRIIEIVPPRGAVSIFGVKLVGFTAENAMKLLLTVVLIALFWALTRLLRRVVRSVLQGRKDARATFWSNQAISITVTLLFLVAFVSIWFDDPTRLTDNWLELTVRFVCRSHDIRELKDVLGREIIQGLDDAQIPLASTTIELTSLPPVRVHVENQA